MKLTLEPAAKAAALIVSVVLFMALLDEAVLVTALPSIARAFGVPPVSLALSMSVYLTTMVAFLPISGWLSERYGARRILIMGIAGFALTSLLCALCRSFWPFIIARAAQGIAGAIMTSVGRQVVLQVTKREELVTALNIITIPMLVAPTLGPAVGGAIVTYTHWSWIFYLNLPFALGAMFFAWKYIPPLQGDATRRLDVVGAGLTAVALILILVGIDQMGIAGRFAGGVALLAAGLSVGALALRHLQHAPQPLVSLAPMRDPIFRVTAITGGGIIRMPIRAMSFILPLMFQLALGFPPLIAGALLLALNGGDLIFKLVVPRILARFGFRTSLLASGLVCIAAIALGLSFHAGSSYGWIMAVIAIGGMGRSVLFTGISAVGFIKMEQSQMGAANVLMNTNLQLTSALSVSVTALILQLVSQSYDRAVPNLWDFHFTLVALTLIALIGWWKLRALPADAGRVMA